MKRLVPFVLSLLAIGGCTHRSDQKPATSAAAPVQRIVSIAPSATEILYAVGAGSRVVAVDDYSDYPAEAKALPRVGSMQMNYEMILAQRPDLVVGVSDLQGGTLAHLAKLGVHTLALDTTSYSRVMAAVRKVGEVTKGDKSEETYRRMASALADVRAMPAPSRVHRVLIVVEAAPKVYVAGRGTFMDDLLQAAGVSNAASEKGFVLVSREGLLAMQPDMVITTNDADRQAMEKQLEGRTARVRIVTAPRDSFVRPGPRLADALAWLARAVRGPVAAR